MRKKISLLLIILNNVDDGGKSPHLQLCAAALHTGCFSIAVYKDFIHKVQQEYSVHVQQETQ